MKKIYAVVLFVLISFSYTFAQVEGTWKLAPQALALGVGPGLGDFSWWSNSAADVTTRACLFDDEFVFNADNSFQNVMGAETWLEGWQGVTEGCGAPIAPHDGSNAATWEYDAAMGTITITGVGAHLGLAKVINLGELAMPGDAPASITYPVVFNAAEDTMTIDIEIQGGAYWHFVLVKGTTNSIDDLVEGQFSFYPNPATTQIQVVSDKLIDMFTIRDITGKIVVERSNTRLNETIDVSAFPAGIYVMESRAGDKRSIEKLVIN